MHGWVHDHVCTHSNMYTAACNGWEDFWLELICEQAMKVQAQLLLTVLSLVQRKQHSRYAVNEHTHPIVVFTYTNPPPPNTSQHFIPWQQQLPVIGRDTIHDTAGQPLVAGGQ